MYIYTYVVFIHIESHRFYVVKIILHVWNWVFVFLLLSYQIATK